MYKVIIILFVLFVLLFSSLSNATDLVVNIENITSTKSPIICALFDSKNGFQMKRKFAKVTVDAELLGDKATCTFKDAPQKLIAISVVEDLNNNGNVDTSFIGFPKEPWAVSNNIKAHQFGPPSFEEAAIDRTAINLIEIQLIKP